MHICFTKPQHHRMSEQNHDKETVAQLKKFLTSRLAHGTLEDVLKDLPAELRGIQPDGLPYSIWQQVEHLRITQWDILDFSHNPDYKEIKWPDDYWIKEKAPQDDTAWAHSLRQIKDDRDAFIALLEKPDADLYAPFPWGKGQTLFREAVLIIDHNSWHMGQIVLLRRLLGAWNK